MAREMTVRTNWVEADFALLNGAPTFITLAERGAARRTRSGSSCPPDGSGPMTGCPIPGAAPHQYRAPDFDTLVDSPIVAGNPAIYRSTWTASRTSW